MKKKAWKWILIFFAGMLAFTIISRAADSVTIPRVKTQMPGKGSLSFSAEGEGTIAAENEQIIFFPAGGKPSEIISAGAEVKRGDTLLRFDMDALKEKAEAENAELKKLELAKKQEALGAGADAQIKEQDAAGRTVSRINEQLDKARGELAKKQDEYNTKIKGGLSDEARQELEEDIRACQEKIETLSESLQEAKNALEDAKANDSVNAKNQQKQKNISELAKQSIQLDIEQKQKEIAGLNKLIKEDGKVTSAVTGTVAETTAVLGAETTGAEYVRIGTGNGRMTACMEKDSVSRLKAKDKITVTPLSGKGEMSGTIESIQEEKTDEETEGKMILTAKVSENDLPIGTRVAFQAKSESQEYGTIVPISAVREDNQGKFVLILSEENTILGTEKIAARVNVKILEKDNSNAAVESSLTGEDKIIVDSNKSIKEGDRVRVE